MKHKVLAELKKSLNHDKLPPVVVKKNPPPKPEPVDEQQLWQQAVAGVLPLHPVNRVNSPPIRPDRHTTLLRRAVAEGEPELDQQGISDTVAMMNPVASEAQLSFRRVGVQLGQYRKLQEGQLRWRSAVDLHGCTVEQARSAVLQLIAEAQEEGINIVKIVHGKGYSQATQGSLLKTYVNGWLQQHNAVLAFCSAPSKDGGNGALLVLLRRTAAAKAAARTAG